MRLAFGFGLALAAQVFVAASPVAAQGTLEQRTACAADAWKFCADVIPNVAKIQACMEARLDKLSPECRAQFGEPARRQKKDGVF
ncbi:MAG: hypothetical protein KGL46_05180 [Hyphomicrobiales bacterium]|nr:hypothetical protein [Hyphomicrobiales bacterium]